jgi:prepilin-type N-terminal cleavage/methylation domain-containing protein
MRMHIKLDSKQELRARLRRLRRARGVTLFEVLIVVAILAMVASGVAVFALPKYREAADQDGRERRAHHAHGGSAVAGGQ